MRWWTFAAVLVCASASWAQEASLMEIELVFTQGGVERGEVREVSGPAPAWYTVPQMHPLFFEVRGAKGQLTFAGVLREPRRMFRDTFSITSSEVTTGGVIEMPSGRAVIVIPKPEEPSRLRVIRRRSFELKGGREVLLETGL